MAHRKRLGEVLIEACIITSDQLEEALRLQQHQHRPIGQILVDMGWVAENDVCRAISELLRIKYVEINDALINHEIVQLAPEELATRRNVLPLFIQDKTLYLAMENPLDIDVIQRIEFRTGLQVKPLIAPPSQLRETIRKHYNVEEYVGNILGQVVEEQTVSVDEDQLVPEDGVDISEVKKISEGSQIVKLANLIISEGIRKRASDIHIELLPNQVHVRYRIDGLLTRGIQIPNWLKLPLISRLKVLAGMDIAERRTPQDGRISVTYAKRKIDLRVSTLPTNFGEKVVIRILDSKASTYDLARLGFSPEHLNAYCMMLNQPQGWILVTGPTGSGKTTTLYASLNKIKDETKNIVTVEDPIEYQLEGINQVQVNPKAGLTFARGLRSILRQDPNVILIGEIRDAETAEIAMQASETGHLVLSTLHTNDAVSTVNRLLNLEIAPDLVASNLLGVIAQRLVRRICPKCKEAYVPSADELQSIGVAFNPNAPLAAYHGSGCPLCHQTGYYGQIGVYEVFLPNDRLRDEIAKRTTKHVLKKLAIQAGMKTLLDDGIEKIRQGVTTIAEVARVCAIEPDESGKIPEERPAKESRAAISIQSDAYAQHLRVVVADDEDLVRDMVQFFLESHNYSVIPASDGDEALAKIRSELPDMVILDVVMPKRDGFSVCKALRSSVETMFIPVVILTAQNSLEEKLEGLASGANEYITKPFDAEDFLARVEAVLHRARRVRQG